MGKGFAFIGRQYPLSVGGQEFFVDLLFYHRRLRCLVAINLKMDAFKPAYVGQMSFYLTALDEIEKHPDDNPSIGLILCRDRNRVVAEYALRSADKPIGVARVRDQRRARPAASAAGRPAIGRGDRGGRRRRAAGGRRGPEREGRLTDINLCC